MKLTLKSIFTIHAVILLIYGLMDLFAAESALSMFGEGTAANAPMLLMIRMMGATFLSLAVLTWFMRDAHLSRGRRAGLFALAVGNVIAAFLQIMAITAGTINEMNWVGVLVSASFALAYIFYGNKEHKMLTEKEARDKVKA
ncbi:MAG: hypothetical protein AAF696_13975 [Bacteroidota bacterium]